MTACPNCGYRHVNADYAPELVDVPVTKNESEILLRLTQARGSFVTMGALIDCLYGDRPDGGPENARTNVCVFLYRVRRKISQRGWAIRNTPVRGYRLVRLPRNEKVAA